MVQAMQQPAVTACSLPVIVEKEAHNSPPTTILNWWSNFEQASRTVVGIPLTCLSLPDIRNCYGSINANLIVEALNSPIGFKEGEQIKLQSKAFSY